LSANLLSSRINAPRYPQFLQSQTDHNCGKPEAQKTLDEPHLGQNLVFRFLVLRLGLAIFAPSYAREDFDFSFLGFLSSRLLGSLGFRTRSAPFVLISLFTTETQLYDDVLF
jgi:hypothetical protein